MPCNLILLPECPAPGAGIQSVPVGLPAHCSGCVSFGGTLLELVPQGCGEKPENLTCLQPESSETETRGALHPLETEKPERPFEELPLQGDNSLEDSRAGILRTLPTLHQVLIFEAVKERGQSFQGGSEQGRNGKVFVPDHTSAIHVVSCLRPGGYKVSGDGFQVVHRTRNWFGLEGALKISWIFKSCPKAG